MTDATKMFDELEAIFRAFDFATRGDHFSASQRLVTKAVDEVENIVVEHGPLEAAEVILSLGLTVLNMGSRNQGE